MSKRSAGAGDAIIGKNIRAHRLARRVSQKALGKAIGVTFQQLQKYEKGKNKLGSGRLVRVAQALKVPVAALLKGVPGAGTKGDAEIGELLAHGHRLRTVRALAQIDNSDVCRSLMVLTENIARVMQRPLPSKKREVGATTRSAGRTHHHRTPPPPHAAAVPLI
jgi:transcriptional regulator with XRE-family HTH domain